MATMLNETGYEDFVGDPGNESEAQKGARTLRNLRRLVASEDRFAMFTLGEDALVVFKPAHVERAWMRLGSDGQGSWS